MGAQLKTELGLCPSGSHTGSPGRVGLAGSLQRCDDVLRANAAFGVTEEHGSLLTSQPLWDFWLGFAASPPHHPMQDEAGARGGLSNPSWDTTANGGAHPRACKKKLLRTDHGLLGYLRGREGLGPGAVGLFGSRPWERSIVWWCWQPGGCCEPGASQRESPNHTGLWRGPPSLGEGEDKAACAHTNAPTHTHTHTHSLHPSLAVPRPCPCIAPIHTGSKRALSARTCSGFASTRRETSAP